MSQYYDNFGDIVEEVTIYLGPNVTIYLGPNVSESSSDNSFTKTNMSIIQQNHSASHLMSLLMSIQYQGPTSKKRKPFSRDFLQDLGGNMSWDLLKKVEEPSELTPQTRFLSKLKA